MLVLLLSSQPEDLMRSLRLERKRSSPLRRELPRQSRRLH